ncbi:interferon regulatory factor 10 isoform X2 [Antennarius striatus]|uniref:interferon regulatory factor 10 isoform X2 n=1 Tax=Antennarius striatus TaxID=241820 RepID=UPI0035B3167E
MGLKMDKRPKMHMKEWLIAQIESGSFTGLCWEDEDKTLFRIPWKHASKKDYILTADAALFKAWAVHKGKYREGRDKADPTMWKTRLRCALNKSSDFQEVPERSQLDITGPYKVYRILPDPDPARPAEDSKTKEQMFIQPEMLPGRRGFMDEWESFKASKGDGNSFSDNILRDHMYCEFTEQKPQKVPVPLPDVTFSISDFRMQVVLLYRGQKVMKVTTRSPDGCFIMQGCAPLGNEQIYGPCTAQQLSFPSPGSVSMPTGMVEAMSRLLSHLERGVLLWVAPEGVFIKRFCQGRVYWSGPMARHADKPNKLEREKTFKLLDVPRFLHELQSCLQGKGSRPSCEIELCFGEEYPDPKVPNTRKLIMAQVVPLFAVELLQRFNLGEMEEKQLSLTFNKGGEQI